MTRIICRMIAIVFTILVCVGLLTSDVYIRADANREQSQEGVSNRAQLIVDEYEMVGQQSIAVLADADQPLKDRAKAARVLGKINFVDAVSTLIAEIRLIDPSVLVVSGNENEPFVCVLALQKLGKAVVPEVLDAYLSETDRVRRRFLLNVISTKELKDIAITYMMGLNSRADDRVNDEVLTTFLKQIAD